MDLFPNGAIVNVSLFGSRVRDDIDDNSDLDVLVVVKNDSGTIDKDNVELVTRSMFGISPSISWYSERKLREMFAQGDLFAWHLFLESKGIKPYGDLSSLYGKPNDYVSALDDMQALHEILVGIASEIVEKPHNVIFELGVLYVCARNIAMAATWHLLPRPDFGRYSPFKLEEPFPVSKDEYLLAMACRMASQRGLPPPGLATPERLLAMHNPLIQWSLRLMEQIGRHAKR